MEVLLAINLETKSAHYTGSTQCFCTKETPSFLGSNTEKKGETKSNGHCANKVAIKAALQSLLSHFLGSFLMGSIIFFVTEVLC